MGDYILETAVKGSDGKLLLCDGCHGESPAMWLCEDCVGTGLFANASIWSERPLVADDRAVVIIRPVYNGIKSGKRGALEVETSPSSHDIIRVTSCCDVFRGYWLRALWNQSVGPLTSETHKAPALVIANRHDQTSKSLTAVVPVVEVRWVTLVYCPNCGTRVQISQTGKRIKVTRIEKVEDKAEYSEPDIVED